MLGHGDPFTLRLVRGHWTGHNVTNGPNAGNRSRKIMIGFDLSARLGDQAGHVERQSVGVGLAADGDEHSVRFYCFRRSEEHTSVLPSLLRRSYAVCCWTNEMKRAKITSTRV